MRPISSKSKRSVYLSRASYLVVGTCLLSSSVGLSTAYGQTESRSDHAPSGWFMAGSAPASYRTGVDTTTTQNGLPSAYLKSAVPLTGGFGTLMQTISASEYAGKRVRLRAWVSSKEVQDWAGVWMRVDKERTMVAFDNMQNRAIKGTENWTAQDVVLDVPADATSISFGVLLSGAGQVWMSNLTFEPVDNTVPVTSPGPSAPPRLSAHPVNLNFTE